MTELDDHQPKSVHDQTAIDAVDVTYPRRSETPTTSKNNEADLEKTLTGTEQAQDSKTIYVEFTEEDPRNPLHFSRKRKWTITAIACLFSLLASSNAASYALGFPSMVYDLNCTRFQAAIGLGMYCLGFGLLPLVSAPFSEELGRKPLYVASIIGFALTHLIAKNIQTIIIGRFLSGAFGSTGATMVGGTIADIWSTADRGLPMSIYSATVLAGTGLGALVAGWVELNSHLQWRWIQWISLILSGALAVAITMFMRETRGSILLMRAAKKKRRETGNMNYRARIEDELPSLRTLLLVSATRPLYLIFTEPVVASFCLWGGFAWGVLYALIETINPVFAKLYNFNSGQVGTIFLTITIGSALGYLTNVYQERIYREKVPIKGPEARLYVVCFTGLLVPIGMFIYAWTSFSFVLWVGPAIGIVVFMWGLFSIYCAGFTYLADVYGPFASSALAGQSLARNLMGMAFPLFTQQMLDKLGYNWSNTLFALVALALVPVPAVLFFYGPRIRARSKFASQVVSKS